MKKIRLGNDIAITWRVTAGSPVDLTDVVVTLIDQYGETCAISEVTTTTTGTTIYQYSFNFYGKDQKRQGVYRILLQRNDGEQGMVTLDHVDAFQLVGVCDFGVVEGNDEDNVVTVTLDLSSTLSTSIPGEGFDPTQYYTKAQTDILLAGKEDELNYYSEDTESGTATIESNDAHVRVLASDAGTVDIQATNVDIHNLAGTNQIVVGDNINVTTGTGKKMNYNGNEVATKNEIPAAVTVDDALSTESENPVQNKVITNALNGKQATIDDLSTIRSGAAAGATAYQLPNGGIPSSDMTTAVQTSLGKADTALQDAPSDGHQYAREDGQWVEVQASGGGGLTIVEVASGTSAITAETDMYYRIAGTVSALAITLPSIGASETMVKKVQLAFTTSNSPSVTFHTPNSETINYYGGYTIGGNNSYEVTAEWNGGLWIVSEIKKAGGGGTGSGEQVTVTVLQKNGDTTSPITTGSEITVVVDGTSTIYTTGPTGNVTFNVPMGQTYTVVAGRRDGYYISGNAYTETHEADQTTRSIVFTYRSYSSGLFICTEDGTDYTLQEWENAVAGGTRTNADALYVHVVTSQLVANGGTFLVPIDYIRERTYVTTTLQWNPNNAQFNSIPLNGSSTTALYYYDGYTATNLIKQEGVQRGLSTPAVNKCAALSETVGGQTAPGFLGSYGQWQILWNNKAEFDDILVSVRPSGTYTLSGLTTNKWTCTQSNATYAYYLGSSFGNTNKSGSYQVIPFFAY